MPDRPNQHDEEPVPYLPAWRDAVPRAGTGWQDYGGQEPQGQAYQGQPFEQGRPYEVQDDPGQQYLAPGYQALGYQQQGYPAQQYPSPGYQAQAYPAQEYRPQGYPAQSSPAQLSPAQEPPTHRGYADLMDFPDEPDFLEQSGDITPIGRRETEVYLEQPGADQQFYPRREVEEPPSAELVPRVARRQAPPVRRSRGRGPVIRAVLGVAIAVCLGVFGYWGWTVFQGEGHGVAEGDCIATLQGDNVKPLDCSAGAARFQVLEIFKDTADPSGCAAVVGASNPLVVQHDGRTDVWCVGPK